MAGRLVMLWAVAVAVAVVGATDCRHNDDCDSGCCLIGRMRHDFPGCSPTRDVGQYCTQGSKASGPHVLNFPGKEAIVVEEGYLGGCPCRDGLVCTCESGGSDCTVGICQ